MSQLRRNPLSGESVIIAPERGRRPKQPQGADEGREGEPRGAIAPGSLGGADSGLPVREEGCPFCPGNEEMLPGIAAELPAGRACTPLGGQNRGFRHEAGWQVRVVPNKFPALEEEGGALGCSEDRGDRVRSIDAGRGKARGCAALEQALPGCGRHEVIIESPRHDLDIAAMSDTAVTLVLEAYRQRLLAARGIPGVAHVVVFRNHGRKAGTSLEHPHSQLVAVPIVPAAAARREEVSREYHAATGRCLLCAMLEREHEYGRRVVLRSEGFDALVPYAAEVPFELWIVPGQHRPDFATVPAQELRHMAWLLKRALSALRRELGDPDYNYVLHTFAAGAADPALHWMIQIRPRVITPAGFEVGSGMGINPSLPEEDARRLRSVC